MIRVYVMVEGQTEETFVRDVLYEHFFNIGIYIDAILVETKKGYKGGLVSYAKVRPQIIRQCREKHSAFVTTLFDLYALPTDFPKKSDQEYGQLTNGHHKVEFLEQALLEDITERNFIPNILVHEYEALLFSNVSAFSDWTDEKTVESLQTIADSCATPEHINDSPHTAPSKRILKLMPEYDKVVQGTLIANDIGLDLIREKCSHFNSWLNKLEKLAEKNK
ncbi:DUF4276 family protein [Thiomicrorhabdus sp. ZW0627]|uniref:DUF4276 family protein n=1 Tax=Thiomicrorhabdus sp. ZW0627 TaxID=3039774 RepID=UPI002436DD62|nr:DUF4276 family protein [Thiomicrorhabdus sp. ZW0627]MDG6774503.1 DUF4276 family protein [Thiomicrorhabdus sp. ZW0627]